MRLSNDRGRCSTASVFTMYDAEDNGNEDQSGHGRERQPADDRAPERRVLLAAFAQAQGHRRHADDHGERGHQYRSKAHEAGLERRRDRVAKRMHMIAPVSAGTDSVVPVANSSHTMPASAAGSAVMMTNGSLHDWKLTTISR